MAISIGDIRPRGDLRLKVLKRDQIARLTLWQVLRDGFPHFGLSAEVNRWRLKNCWRLVVPALKLPFLNFLKVSFLAPQLHLTLFRGEQQVDLGLASLRLVTDAGVAFIATRLVDAAATIGGFDFHGFGTGGTAESASQTALVTELTTEYVTNSTRPTGTPSNSSANVYQSIGTLSPDSGGTLAITEHGLFSANAAGTMLDRSLFSAVNLVASADSLQATYQLTLASGG